MRSDTTRNEALGHGMPLFLWQGLGVLQLGAVGAAWGRSVHGPFLLGGSLLPDTPHTADQHSRRAIQFSGEIQQRWKSVA